jgi:hypothetical protein
VPHHSPVQLFITTRAPWRSVIRACWPARDCRPVGRLRDLDVIDASDVLKDAIRGAVPNIDAKGKVGLGLHRGQNPTGLARAPRYLYPHVVASCNLPRLLRTLPAQPRAIAAQLHFLNGMTAAREMFGKSYFSLGLSEKFAVDQAVLGMVAANYQSLTAESLAAVRPASQARQGRDALRLALYTDVAKQPVTKSVKKPPIETVRNLIALRNPPTLQNLRADDHSWVTNL